MTIHPHPITFRKAGPADRDLLLSWLGEPHVRAFWDNSEDGHVNLLGYLEGVKELYDYWIGALDGTRFCLVMTSDAREDEPEHLAPHVSPHGETWAVDFMIGSTAHLGRGLAAPALAAFAGHARSVEPRIASLLIDPAAGNSRAIHVYQKAGFRRVSEFTPREGPFAGIRHILMSLALANAGKNWSE